MAKSKKPDPIPLVQAKPFKNKNLFFSPVTPLPRNLVAQPIYTAENPPPDLFAALDSAVAWICNQPSHPMPTKTELWQRVETETEFARWISKSMFFEIVWPRAPEAWRAQGRRRRRR